MNTEEKKELSSYEEYMAEEEARRKAEATAKRKDYLSKAGPFDPWTFLEAAGWKIGQMHQNKHAFLNHPTNKEMHFSVADGAIFEKPKSIRVKIFSNLRADEEAGKTKEAYFQLPTDPDDVYGFLESFDMMKLSKYDKERIERNYVVTKLQRQ